MSRLTTVVLALLLGVASAADRSISANTEIALRKALFTRTADDGRTFGTQDLDILFWSTTEHLLTQPSHSQALKALDDFIAKGGEQELRDPVRRAWLQRDLWQLFDWAFKPGYRDGQGTRGALRSRLATAIRRLAPNELQVASLPDNLATLKTLEGGADFPASFDGEWVVVSVEGTGAVAPSHMISFGGRSTFNVLVRLPGGRAKTLAWLHAVQQQLSDGGADDFNAKLPNLNFPVGTRWALVRTLNVIDDRGNLRATRWVESVQTRLYADPSSPMRPPLPGDSTPAPQIFAEAHADRANLPGLVVLGANDREFTFVHFASMGIDPFEIGLHNNVVDSNNPARARGIVLRECAQCHHGPGLSSVRSVLGIEQAFHAKPEGVRLVAGSVDREAGLTLEWKQERPEWKELRRLWEEAR
jgi:hypothetical protein